MDEMDERSETATRSPFTRRAFLLGGGAAAASVWVLGPNGSFRRPNMLARLAAGPHQMLSIGYVEGSAGVGSAEVHDLLTAGTRVVPATALRSGDSALAGQSAQIGVHGP